MVNKDNTEELKIQIVEVKRVPFIHKFVKRLSVRPYNQNMPESHFNSRNSNLDYKA